MGAYFNVAVSGSGVSGSILPRSGTITFTIYTSASDASITPYIYPIDSSGNIINYNMSSSSVGGNWSPTDSFQTFPGSPKAVTVNMSTFVSAFSGYSNLNGLRMTVFCNSSSDGWINAEDFDFGLAVPYTACGAPSSPTLDSTLGHGPVKLSWGAGSAGTNNSVVGYDVEYRESGDGSNWGSWFGYPGSPTTATSIDVWPSDIVGNYRQFRVRTRGSAGESYYSGWVISNNTLRKKWNDFGAYTDSTLAPRTFYIRAVYITELQTRVNTIRTFYGLGAYNFTMVTAGVTKVSKWATLIQEIRTAIDGISTSHESWNTLEAGKPRIAHIMQLRNIIDKL